MAEDEHDVDDACIKYFMTSTFSNKQISIVKSLPSFEDTNMLLRVRDELSDTSYVLKRYNRFRSTSLCDSPAESFVLEQKTKFANYLRQQGFLCPTFIKVPGTNEQFLHRIESSETKTTHLCLLYLFLPGSELEKTVDISHPVIMFELGFLLGQLHKTLKNVPHDGLEPDPTEPWHMCNIHLLNGEQYKDIVKDTGKRQKLKEILNLLSERFKSSIPLLQKCILHGDFHGLNLIVDEEFTIQSRLAKFHHHQKIEDILFTELEKQRHLSDFKLSHLAELLANKMDFIDKEELLQSYGIIDFESVIYSNRILEVGRTIADLMATILSQSSHEENKKLGFCRSDTDVTSSEQPGKFKDLSETVQFDGNMKFHPEGAEETDGVKIMGNSVSEMKNIFSTFPNILNAGGFVLSGYLMSSTLTKDELDFLKEAVMISLAQYFILGSAAALENSDNNEYSSQCSREAEVLLFELYNTETEELHRAWMEAAVTFLSGAKCH